MTIDAHHHLWKYNAAEYPWMTSGLDALRRDFLLPDLDRVMAESRLDGTVAVQARQTMVETEWLLDLADQYNGIRGVVGWAPLVDPEIRKYLERFAGSRTLRGMRHVLHDEPDDFYMLREDFNRGVAALGEFGFVYDILIFEKHLPQTIEFVDRHPNQIFIVDHIAKPKIREQVLSPWRELMTELAKRENVYSKVSGLVTEADWEHWKPADLEPYLDTVLRAFGPRRLMYGSDWPVILLASTYTRYFRVVLDWTGRLSADEQAWILGGTAAKAYRL